MWKTTIAILMSANAVFADESGTQPADVLQERPRNTYIAALIGPAILTSDAKGGSNNFLTYGGRAGTAIYPDPNGVLSIGVVVNTLSNSATVSGVKADGRITTLMGEVISRRLFETGLYFGGRVGIAFNDLSVSASATSLSASSTSFAVGPVIGYEVSVSPVISLDIDVSWISRDGGSFTFPGIASVQYSAISAFFLQGGLLAHF